MYNLLNEGFNRKYLKEDVYTKLEKELKNALIKHGYDVTVDDADQAIASFAEYIQMSREYGDPMTVEDWIKETEFNYPEELAFMKTEVVEEACSKKLEEKVKSDKEIYAELVNELKWRGYDPTTSEAREYLLSVVDDMSTAMDLGYDKYFSAERWLNDMENDNPEEIAFMKVRDESLKEEKVENELNQVEDELKEEVDISDPDFRKRIHGTSRMGYVVEPSDALMNAAKSLLANHGITAPLKRYSDHARYICRSRSSLAPSLIDDFNKLNTQFDKEYDGSVCALKNYDSKDVYFEVYGPYINMDKLFKFNSYVNESLKEEVKEKVIFHNDNGVDYDVIERSKSGQNALLNRGKQWIVAWNCPQNNKGSWGQGHYFFDEKSAREVWEDKYLNESLEEADKFDFNSDFYNAVADVMFKYRDKDVDIKDAAKAYEWFELHFFDNEFYEKLQECINRLNEAEMSDEDKKDSEILWNIYNKTQQRANAKLTDEEKAVLNKYNLTRDSDYKNIIKKFNNVPYPHTGPVVSDQIKRATSRGGRYHNGRYVNTNAKQSDINLADKARKMNDRGAYGYYNTLARNWNYDRNDHREYRDPQTGKYVRLNDKGLLDAERDSENIRMQEPVSRMKKALDTRDQKQKSLASIDARFDAEKAKAQQDYEKKLADIERSRKWNREWDEDSLNNANATINKLLKKDKQ